MKTYLIPALLLLPLASRPALAQLDATVGPSPAPLGAPISVAVSNDTPALVGTGVCNFAVQDANGNPVFTFIACPEILALIPAGEVFVNSWNQLDDLGNPVPAGSYTVDVFLPDGTTKSFPLTLGGVDAAATLHGVPRIGTTRALRLVSPLDPGFPYVAAASGAVAPGIATCAGALPIAPDFLFLLSLSGSSAFQNFAGTLDGTGESVDPQVSIPPSPALVGLPLAFAFLTLDLAQPCPVRRISAPLAVTVL